MALPMHLFSEMAEELRAQGIQWGNERIRETAMRLSRPVVTTDVNVERYMDLKRDALAKHRSQMPPDSRFDRLSEGLRRKFVGHEYFHRAAPPWQEGEPEEDWVLG